MIADLNSIYNNVHSEKQSPTPSFGLYHPEILEKWADEFNHVSEIFIPFIGRHVTFEKLLCFVERAKNTCMDNYRFMELGLNFVERLHEYGYKNADRVQQFKRIDANNKPPEEIASLVESLIDEPAVNKQK